MTRAELKLMRDEIAATTKALREKVAEQTALIGALTVRLDALEQRIAPEPESDSARERQ